MRTLIFYLLVFFSQVSMGQASSDEKSKAFRFVDSLFKEGDFVFQINDVVFPPKLQKILSKIQKSMAENKEWFEQYFNKNAKDGEALPYNAKFGVTKESLRQLLKILLPWRRRTGY